MTKALEQALHSAKDWLDGLDDRPVQARADMAALRSRFEGSLPEVGIPPADVVSHLVTNTTDGLLGSAGGRFYAWVIGGGLLDYSGYGPTSIERVGPAAISRELACSQMTVYRALKD